MALLIRIDRYLRETSLPVTRFGRLVANDPRLVSDLRRGRKPGRKLVEQIESFMARPQP